MSVKACAEYRTDDFREINLAIVQPGGVALKTLTL